MKTYNFIEAVNSGKRFRPVQWVDDLTWCSLDDFKEVRANETGSMTWELEFFNSQFILKEQKITITESEFDEALSDYELYGDYDIKEQLGFKK